MKESQFFNGGARMSIESSTPRTHSDMSHVPRQRISGLALGSPGSWNVRVSRGRYTQRREHHNRHGPVALGAAGQRHGHGTGGCSRGRRTRLWSLRKAWTRRIFSVRRSQMWSSVVAGWESCPGVVYRGVLGRTSFPRAIGSARPSPSYWVQLVRCFSDIEGNRLGDRSA